MKIQDTQSRLMAENADLNGSRFQDVNLSGAVFQNVALKGANLHDVDLSDVTIDNAKLTGMKINGYDVGALFAAHAAMKENSNDD